jgi:uncharacterized membrane protein YbhN (UPF0104 family)
VKKKQVIILLKVAVSLILLLYALDRAGLDSIISSFKEMNTPLFFAAAAIFLTSLFFASIRWGLLITVDGGTNRFKTSRLLALYLITAFFNRLLPGLVTGDAFRMYYLYKDTSSGTLSVGSVFADRYIGFTALISLGLMVFPFVAGNFKGTGIATAFLLIAFCFILISFSVFLFKIGDRFSTVRNFYDYAFSIKKRPRIVLKAYLLSIGVHILGILSLFVISIAMGIRLSLWDFFLFVPIITTVTTIPVSISGIGVREATCIVLLGQAGVQPEKAFAISIAWFLSYVLGSLPGLIIYIKWKTREEN